MSGIYENHQTTSSEPMFRSLGDLFFHSLNKFSERIFQYLDDTNEKITYSDILEWSVSVATKLKERGITENDIICSCSHNQKFSAIPFIATQFLGAVICNLDPKLSHIDTVHLLKLIQPKILFVAEESLHFIEKCLNKANVTTDMVVFGKSNKYTQFSEYVISVNKRNFKLKTILDNSAPAAIFCSSGTTGLPKGICLSHKALIKSANLNISLDSNDPMVPNIILMYPTLYWISAAFNLIRATLMGFASVVCKDFDPAHTWKLIEKYKVVDIDTEEVLGPNRQGELRLKWDGYLMNGYFKMDTSSAYDTEGYFKTGDVVYYDEDECFYVENRIKEIFKYRGWHVLPAIIENVLLLHPAVKEAAVIGVPHEVDGEHPRAFVVLIPGFDQSCAKEIQTFVNEKVADSQKLRGGVWIVDSIPKTATGKIRRMDLGNFILNNIKVSD
ncbi:luciferin 4-monooxygenase-like isoform X2 [Diabrotica undecimpunctata]|uniref:luciferin 4-monooxygenase-like isoform X2 n=1 Tax=Diabrotica undecimpunctata TaxID=50387 RepID=UPI003B63B7B0